MGKFSSEEALDWLNKVDTIQQWRKEDPNLTGVQLAGKLEGSKARASYLTSLSECLDQAANSNSPFILSFNSARALAALSKAELADLPTTLKRRPHYPPLFSSLPARIGKKPRPSTGSPALAIPSAPNCVRWYCPRLRVVENDIKPQGLSPITGLTQPPAPGFRRFSF
jgi:hypothetical protein